MTMYLNSNISIYIPNSSETLTILSYGEYQGEYKDGIVNREGSRKQDPRRVPFVIQESEEFQIVSWIRSRSKKDRVPQPEGSGRVLRTIRV